MVEIIVKKRRDDYHVCVKGCEGVWSCGKSTITAIGTLVSDHPELFGIKLNYEES